jgi:hypothetical protein
MVEIEKEERKTGVKKRHEKTEWDWDRVGKHLREQTKRDHPNLMDK